MSRITDMVDEEAARAEAEPDSGEGEGEPEGEPEPELDEDEAADEEEGAGAEPVAQGPSEAQLRDMERENTRHEKALAKVVGDDWHLFSPCGHCGGVGFSPFPPRELRPDETTQRCDACNGWGMVQTESRVPGEDERGCGRCGGTGILVKMTNVATTGTPAPSAVPTLTPLPSVGNGGAPEPPSAAELRAMGYVVVPPVAPAAS